MKQKLLLVSLLVVTAFAITQQGYRPIYQGMALTNQWAMAALFWGHMLESPSGHALPAAASVTNAVNVQPTADTEEEFRWQGRTQAGQTLEVKGVNGSVRAEGTSGNQIEVVATKRGRRSNPKEVEIRVLEHAGGVTICAVYPSDDASRPNECQPGKGGRMNVSNNDVSVDFTVKVPAGVRFAGRTVNGGVEAERIESDVDVSTVNGSVKVSATGLARATTVNGSIKAAMGSANWAGELKFTTVNGSIILDFPAGLSAEMSAETLNGEIISDFPLNTQGVQADDAEERRGRPKRVSATIGAGGRNLSLKTVNGDIRIRRTGERTV